jgi:hypothetical protein
MTIRDRIKDFRRVPARELIAHDRNWRKHPPQQAAALAGVLAEIGYADALLVRERNDGRLELIDGHLRAATTPDQLVPVLVLDVSRDEAAKILLTHDPLTNLATPDGDAFAQLRESVSFENETVRAMLDSLSEQLGQLAASEKPRSQRDEPPLPRSFQVAVECHDESQQEKLFNRLTREGFACRLLTM